MALTHAVIAHAAAVAVVGAARARLGPRHERGEDHGEERAVANKTRHHARERAAQHVLSGGGGKPTQKGFGPRVGLLSPPRPSTYYIHLLRLYALVWMANSQLSHNRASHPLLHEDLVRRVVCRSQQRRLSMEPFFADATVNKQSKGRQ